MARGVIPPGFVDSIALNLYHDGSEGIQVGTGRGGGAIVTKGCVCAQAQQKMSHHHQNRGIVGGSGGVASAEAAVRTTVPPLPPLPPLPPQSVSRQCLLVHLVSPPRLSSLGMRMCTEAALSLPKPSPHRATLTTRLASCAPSSACASTRTAGCPSAAPCSAPPTTPSSCPCRGGEIEPRAGAVARPVWCG